jgi:hypothetical protein
MTFFYLPIKYKSDECFNSIRAICCFDSTALHDKKSQRALSMNEISHHYRPHFDYQVHKGYFIHERAPQRALHGIISTGEARKASHNKNPAKEH